MDLKALDRSAFELVVRWLQAKENYQWLDFGSGNQLLHPAALRMMLERDNHCFRVFAAEPTGAPIGLVVLSHISPNFRTAMLWYVLGDKSAGGRGYTTQAVRRMLDLGFGERSLHVIYAWTVEANGPSIRVLERNGFRLMGRQRQCHMVGGQWFDRLLFDLLAEEYARNKTDV